MSCPCKNTTPGSVERIALQPAIPVPDTVDIRFTPPSQRKRRTVCVDQCIAGEIAGLWARGIRTHGCCCGHGDPGTAYIGVEREFIGQMQALGYEPAGHPDADQAPMYFKPKSGWCK